MRGALATVVWLVLAGSACRGGAAGGEAGPPDPPRIAADGAGYLFFWFDADGAVSRAESPEAVPIEARGRVLVQSVDPGAPSSGAWAFVADLRTIREDGTYAVEVIPREAYSEEVRARFASVVEPASTGPAAPPGRDDAGAATAADAGAVEIYLTQGCPHCRRAKEWLRRNGIPFVEFDLEEDAAAARWVQRNTGATAVPVFRIGKRILQGFNPEALQRAVEQELGIRIL
jgi:glutaredoxin